MKRLGALIACAILGACATQAQQQQQAATEAVNACWAQVRSTPAGTRVAGYIVLNEDDPAKLEKLSDPRFVDEAMRSDLMEVHRAGQPCRSMFKKNLNDLHLRFGQVEEARSAADDRTLLELLNGQITIGKANEAFLEIARLSKQALLTTATTLDQQRAAAYAAQEQQRQAGLNMLQQWALQQQQPRRSMTTDCTVFGNTLNCNSF